jgi:hypothetical protein
MSNFEPLAHKCDLDCDIPEHHKNEAKRQMVVKIKHAYTMKHAKTLVSGISDR